MRIRQLLSAAIATSLAVGALAAAAVFAAGRAETAAGDAQTRAQFVAHQVTGLLALTLEYARYLEPRAAEQWHRRRVAIVAALHDEDAVPHTDSAFIGLKGSAEALPELFARLEDIPRTGADFDVRRREALLDQLLTSTQAMSDYADQWFQDATAARRLAGRQFQIVAFSTPLAMLALFVGLTFVVRRRVLLPVQTLADAAAQVGRGDLRLRLAERMAGRTDDELGDLARQFDAMAAALDASGEKTRRSEKQLRAVTDNLPALIAYIDADEVYRFANAHYRVVYGIDPRSVIGTTVEQRLGAEAYRQVQGEIAAVLRGERRTFEHREFHVDASRHLIINYIPDVDAAGAVVGFYAMVSDITSRKNAELARARSERLLRTITDNLPKLIAYIDRDERFRFANGQYRTLLGIDPETLIGRTVQEGLGAESHAILQPHLAATFAGERRQFERVNSAGGTATRLLTDYFPDFDEHGTVVGIFAMTVDVTERRLAEARLRDSERRLRAITDNIPAMIGHFDAEERCTFANTTVLKVNGLTQADVGRRTLRGGIGEEAYAFHAPHVQAALRGEERSFEGHVRRNGRDAYFQAHLVPDRGADGATCGFYVMTFDVTAVRRAELARAKSEQRLRQITDNLPVLISYFDRQQRLTFANATFGPWLGRDPEALLGKHLSELMGAGFYAERRTQIEEALRGTRVEFEGEMPCLDTTRTTQTCYIPDVDATGAVQGVYAMSTDVTSLKKVERQLQALARFDTLTGLPNRLHYNEQLPQALARSARSELGLALMFLDIDHFKLINDSFGHAAGDAVLKEFAHRLRASVRVTDTVVRLAGDEFVIVLEGLHGEDEPRAIADKIIAAMARPFHVDGHDFAVTTSVGISYHDTGFGDTTPGQLLDRADKALYKAKAAGRNVHRSA